jgi:hypothetical protein
MRLQTFSMLDWTLQLLGYYYYQEMDMTIYGQKISYDRTLDEYVVVSATPSYLNDLSFFSNQINSSKIQNMSQKLNTIEKIINAE